MLEAKGKAHEGMVAQLNAMKVITVGVVDTVIDCVIVCCPDGWWLEESLLSFFSLFLTLPPTPNPIIGGG